MVFIADFHLHSKYSRATSREMNLENLDKWAKIKGIKVLGTGDFTHPEWFKNLKEKLEPAEAGLYKLKSEIRDSKFETNSKNGTRFILTSEVSCIYSKNGKIRKIHIIIFAPSIEVVEKINTHLSWIGNLKADGRPILGLDAKELVKIVLNISENCLIVPAHAWTPHFSIFGSRSGFDSIEECFEDYSKYIYAIETGLSSNPSMNWRLSALDKLTLISCSDAHSLQKIGREANVFNTELNYLSIIEAIQSKNPRKILYTIEFYPEEGKYHYDGHRFCQVRLSPKERKEFGGICPVCKGPLTIGVLSRVEELSDRKEGFVPENAIPFKSLVPLKEIIAQAFSSSENSREVEKEYEKLLFYFKNEFEILLNLPILEISKISQKVAEGIKKVREGKIKILPGFDGQYGKVMIWEKKEEKIPSQKRLF